MNRSQKEALKEKIEKLSPQEHAHIFEFIVQRYTKTYTKTQEGVLVSSENLPDECLAELERYADFQLHMKKVLEDSDASRKTN